MIRFLAGTREAWVGNFQRGLCSFDQVVAFPDGQHVLVIAGGSAYLVHPATKSIIASLGGQVESCTPTPDARGFVLSDLTDIELVNGSGLVWRSRRLAWDGVRVLQVTGDDVLGEARHYDDTWHPFRVSLANGEATGGAYEEVANAPSGIYLRASLMFKAAITGWMMAAISTALLFAGYPQAKPFAVLGVLLGCGAIAAGAIASLGGGLINDLKGRQ